MWLYHATFQENAAQIQQQGLLRNKPSNFDGMCMQSMIYFAFNPEVAINFVEASDNFQNQNIVVFAVETSNLSCEKVRYDWNNRCEYHTDIVSLAYEDDVPAKCLMLVTEKDINTANLTEIDDLQYGDDDACHIWAKLLDTFYECVESNKEDGD